MSALAAEVAVTSYPSHGGPPRHGMVELHYQPLDPWAIRLRATNTVWLFARDLLADGLTARTGAGDVQVGPLPGGLVAIWLADAARADGRRGRLVARAPELARVVLATYQMVPRGREEQCVDFDQLAARLLAAGARRPGGDEPRRGRSAGGGSS